MIYNIEKLVDVIGGISAQISNPGAMIERVIIDSRQVSTPNHTIFIAIVGKRKDGHTFIGSLYDQGIRNFIISEPCSYGQYPQANFVLVENGVTALQTWARVHRSQFDIPIVGVTGSNGKTIVKEWLHHLMVPDFFVTKSPKSYNSQIGVPLSVLQLTAASELAIFEAGISQPGEMVRLEQIIHPQLGIFTNLGSAHDQGFNSRLQKAKEKALFFRSSDLVVCCREHQLIRRALQELQIQMFTWSMSDHEADLFISGIEVEHNQTSIWYKADRSDGLITIPFVDQVSIENALHCLALMIVLEMPQAAFEGKFSNLQPVAMRLEAVKGINGCQIINDVYNADLESIQGALAFTDQQTDLSKKTIVLSDLQQLTDDKSTLYRQVADMVRAKGFSRFIGVGNDIRRIKPHLSNSTNSAFYRNTEELLTDLPNLHFDQELILIKGARNYGLEEVTKRLSAQRHSTVLEINLAALARNLKVMEGYLNPQTKIMAMVKAAAYGSGAIEIGRMLVSRRIDYLAVAYPDEGVELRNAGITLPVVILNPEIDSLALLVRYKLEPEIFSLTDLQFTRGWTDKNKQTLDIHLKIDSGMHRQGLQADDVDQVIGCIKDSLFLKVKSIFSHLSASDEPEQDSFTLQQIELFDKTANRIRKQLGYPVLLHILNSNGVVRFPEYQFDMVRLGIGIYGINMPEGIGLEPVHTLKSTISQVKWVMKGASIGYGRKEITKRNMRIAIVRIGYADGLIRKAGSRRYALVVRGKKAPIVGNICMDVTMIEVTDIQDVSEGDEVIVFGDRPRVSELAEAAETIPYEVFTNISNRTKRIYVYD